MSESQRAKKWNLMARQFERLAEDLGPVPHVLAMWPKSTHLPRNEFGHVQRLKTSTHPFECGWLERQVYPNPNIDPRKKFIQIVQFEWWSPINDGSEVPSSCVKLRNLIGEAAATLTGIDAGPFENCSDERRRWTGSLHFLLSGRRIHFSADRWHHLDPPIAAQDAPAIEVETDEWQGTDMVITEFLRSYCDVQLCNSRPRFGMIGIVLPDDVFNGSGQLIYSVLDDFVTSSAIACELLADRPPRRNQPKKPSVVFPAPANASWSDVHMKFIDGEAVSITIHDVTKRFIYSEMGMIDDRNKKPTKQWDLLRDFARGYGSMSWSDPGADRKNQKRREVLSRDLRAFFQIDSDPIEWTKEKRWRTKFSLEPDA